MAAVSLWGPWSQACTPLRRSHLGVSYGFAAAPGDQRPARTAPTSGTRRIGSSATNGAGRAVLYDYDIGSALVGITYPSGLHVTRTIDAMGRVVTLDDGLGHATTFSYDADGNISTVSYPNGVTGRFTYDAAERVTAIQYLTGAGRSLAQFQYERDAIGFLTKTVAKGVPPHIERYGYTSLDQLARVNSTSYQYDAVGRLVRSGKEVLSYDDGDQLVSLAPNPSSRRKTLFTYDATGARSQRDEARGTDTLYVYDQENRLTAIGSVGGAAVAQYAYDGLGLRSGKTVEGVPEEFTWQLVGGLPLVLEAGDVSFVYGPGGQPLQQIDGSGRVVFFHQDQLGSARLLTDDVGHTVRKFRYDAYGEPIGRVHTDTPLQYASQFTDFESGLQYLRARYYNPATGQLLTRDPGEPREPYAYAGGNPANMNDPSGFDAVFAGHGTYSRKNGYTVVPECTTFVIYSPPGTRITDDYGRMIERGEVPATAYRVEYGPGSKIPNLELHPPYGLELSGRPVIKVKKPKLLSESLEPNEGKRHHGACQEPNDRDAVRGPVWNEKGLLTPGSDGQRNPVTSKPWDPETWVDPRRWPQVYRYDPQWFDWDSAPLNRRFGPS